MKMNEIQLSCIVKTNLSKDTVQPAFPLVSRTVLPPNDETV